MIESLLMTQKNADVQQKEQAELIGKMSQGLEYADVVEVAANNIYLNTYMFDEFFYQLFRKIEIYC